MKHCSYTLELNDNNKITFNSEAELNEYIKNNKSNIWFKANDAIYSKLDPVIKSVNILNGISVTTGTPASKYIELQFLINGQEKRLVPEYIEKNRHDNELELFLKNKTKTKEEFEVYWKDKLHKEELNNKLGNTIHNLVNLGLKYTTSNSKYKQEISKLISEDFSELIGDGNAEDFKNNINGLVNTIIRKISAIYNDGQVLPEFKISAIDYLDQNITGKIDILGVNKNGDLDIIELKLSEKDYSDWDSAKKANTMAQLMLYRQMLAQHGFQGSKINLYVIPLKYIPGKVKSMTINSNSTVNVLRIGGNTNEDNYISFNGNKNSEIKYLIPAKTSIEIVDEPKVNTQISTFLSNFFPKYNFKTQVQKASYEYELERALKRHDGNGQYRFYNEETDTDEVVQDNTKEHDKLKKRLQEYITLRDSNKTLEIKKATDSFIQILKEIKTSKDFSVPELQAFSKFKQKSENVKAAHFSFFEKYLTPDWSVIESDTLLNAGIIGFEHLNGKCEFIIFTVNHLNNQQNLGKGETILGKHLSINDINKKGYKDVMPSTNANIELIKAMTVINSLSNYFEDDRYLSKIQVMNYLNGQSNTENLNKLIHNFNLLINTSKNVNPDLIFDNNFNSIKVASTIGSLEDEIYDLCRRSSDSKLQNLYIGLETDEVRMSKLEKIHALANRLIEAYPYLTKPVNAKRDFISKEEQLLELLGKASNFYSGINFKGDYSVSNTGVNFSELLDVAKAPFSYNTSELDSKGRHKVGLGGGLKLASTDGLPSTDLNQIMKYFNFAIQNTRDLYNPRMNEITNQTKQWQSKLGKSDLSSFVLAKTYDINKNLFRTVGNGELDPELLFKNPFTDTMNPHDSEYLKYMLWQINKWKVKGLSKEERKLDYKEAYKLANVQEAITKSSFFEVPLERGTIYTRYAGMTMESVKDSIKDHLYDMKQWYDRREITEEQKLDISDQIKNYNFMSNRFRMSSNTRRMMLQNHPINYWEINLDKIVLDHELEYLRENAINKVLPTVNLALLTLQFDANKTGLNASPALDYFYDYIKSAIFNESLISDEAEDVMKVVYAGQKMLRIPALAFKLTSAIKEITVGTISNISRAETEVYGTNSFKAEHIKKAYNIIIGVDNKLSRDFNIVRGIDSLYGLSNMDLSNVVERTRADRTGIFSGGLNKKMYWTSSIGDYVNRNALFLAQMIRDGSYDAHSLDENNNIIYDWTKDKRFEEYAKNKNNPNYTSTKFLEQKALYYSYIKQLQLEGTLNKKENLISFGDDLPKAYTTLDRESFKSFADMTYGYFDHEKRSLFNQTAWGITMMQFKTYWTGRWRTWMIKPGTETAQGKFVKKFTTDGQPIYYKEILDKDGNVIDVEETTETDGTLDQAIGWEGNRMEGLFWSLMHTFRDIIHLRFDDAFSNKERINRTKLAMHDIFINIIMTLFAGLLFKEINEDAGINLNNKREHRDFYQNNLATSEILALNIMKEFNPISNTIGAISLTPSFIDFSQRVGNDGLKVLSGDKSIYDYSRKYIGAMQVLPK